MSIWHAIVLGLIQGITEFLPISSSAHLILFPEFFGWADAPLVFDTSLHIGTTLAVLIYFYKDFLHLNRQMLTYLIIGSVPVVILGLLGGDYIDMYLTSPLFLALFIFLGTALMSLAEAKSTKSTQTELSVKKVTIIGIFQSLALFPGVSRSGATISAGLFAGLDREQATKFSFLLSTPAVVAAAGYKLLTTYKDLASIGYTSWALGIFVSFIVGLFSIKFMLTYVKTNTLKPFILYRVILALLVLATF